MSTLSERVEIQYTRRKLSFWNESVIRSARNHYQQHRTSRRCRPDWSTEILQGVSVSSTWVSSRKCQSFSDMELYMKSDYPLIIRFHNVTSVSWNCAWVSWRMLNCFV
jgi:hypothetical protein